MRVHAACMEAPVEIVPSRTPQASAIPFNSETKLEYLRGSCPRTLRVAQVRAVSYNLARCED